MAETVIVFLNDHKTYSTIPVEESLITAFPASSVKAKWGSIFPSLPPSASGSLAKGVAKNNPGVAEFLK